MKQFAADENLSGEARESAKKALEVLVSSELVDIEQAAARRKRAGELKVLESEAQFVDQQAQIERIAARKKLEADLEAEKLDLEVKKQGIEVKKQSMQVAVKEKSEAAAFGEMTEWLGQHRLQDYTADVPRIAGA